VTVHPLTPRDTPHQHIQQEDQPQNILEEEEPFEIEIEEEHDQQQDTNNDEQQQHDNNNDQHQESDCTPDNDAEESDTRNKPFYHDASEFRSYGEESPTIISQLHSLLFHLSITEASEFKIKRIPRPRREEFCATLEIYNETRVVRKHKGPAFRSTCAEAISDAAWQAMTSFNRTRRDKLKGSIYFLFPQRKKNTFKISGVKNNIPKTMTIHS
jgi:hypothetical protein